MLETEMPCNVNTEPADPVIEPVDETIASQIEDVSDFQNELVEQEENEAAELEGASQALEAYSSLLKQAGDKGITHQSAAVLRVGMKQIDRVLGNDKGVASLESFQTCHLRDGLRHTTVSVEDIKERATQLAEKFLAFLKRLLEKAKELWNKLAGPKTKVREQAEMLRLAAPAFPAYPGGKMRGSVPDHVSESIRQAAEAIANRKGDVDEESKKLRIEDTVNISSDGVNTYDTIENEKIYAGFIYHTLPLALLSIMKHAIRTVGKGDSQEYMAGVLEFTHNELTNLTNSKINDRHLPGLGKLVWSQEAIGFKFEEGKGPIQPVELELRPTTKITQFAKHCEETLNMVTSDEVVNKNSGNLQKTADDLAAKILTQQKDPAVFAAISGLITKIRSLDVLVAADRQIIKSIHAKLKIAEHELTLY